MENSVSLGQVLCGVQYDSRGKAPDAELKVSGLTDDSRSVSIGNLFFAIPGTKLDGSQFVLDALKQGALAVVGAKALFEAPELANSCISGVEDVRAALA